jgi:hypothetical protein
VQIGDVEDARHSGRDDEIGEVPRHTGGERW